MAGSLAGPRAARALGRHGAMAAGLAAIAAGALALRGIDERATALPALMTGFAVMGAGLGIASVASTALGTEALDTARQGVASGLITTSAQIGTALGLAVIVPLAGTAAAAGDGARVDGYRIGFTVAAAARGRGRRLRRAQRSPGCLSGFTDTGTDRSSAVRMIRFCSIVWAAG